MNQNKIKPNVLDRFIGFFSPQQQFKRVVARQKVARKYEGASSTRRTKGWSTSNASSAAETYRSLDALRNRSRDLIQNNTYAKRGCDAIVNNVVGKGIYPQIIDDKSQSRAEKIGQIFKNWMMSTECDFEITKNFFMLQRLVTRATFESGECLVVRRYSSSKEYQYAPLNLQILEPDHLDSTGYYSKPASGNKLIQGIEYNFQGRRVAYHVFKEHPGGLSPIRETVRIDASDVIHVFDELRPGQVRGVPYLSPAIIKLRDYDEYEDAQLMRQKIASCFAGFIKDMELPDDGEYSDDEQELLEKIEPGTLEVLPPGKDISFPNTPTVEGISDFSKISLRAVASALGISYEALTMDYSNVNFSSGRMGWIEMHRTIEDFRNNVIMPKFLDQVFMWFLESVSFLGVKTENINWSWTPPKREMIDPSAEITSMIEGMQAGIMTLSGTLQSMGVDPEDHIKQLKNDLDLLDKYGLKLSSDPRNPQKDLSTKQSSGG